MYSGGTFFHGSVRHHMLENDNRGDHNVIDLPSTMKRNNIGVLGIWYSAVTTLRGVSLDKKKKILAQSVMAAHGGTYSNRDIIQGVPGQSQD